MTSPAFSSTNSAEIIADTLAGLPACLHYEIKGSCFWLNPTGAIITTPYVQHYLPDVGRQCIQSIRSKSVVGNRGHPRSGGSSWRKIGIVSFIAGVPAAGGQHSFHHPMEQHVFFKEVDILGNPAITGIANDTGLIVIRSRAFATVFSIHAGQRLVARISADGFTGTGDGVC